MTTFTRLGLVTALFLAAASPDHILRAQSRSTSEVESALGARFSISPEELSPASTLEVVFPTPMIGKEQIGTVADENPLQAKPSLEGEFHWISTRSGHFRLKQAPSFNTSYEFALRAGLKDLEGKPLDPAPLATVSSAAFKILDHWPRWFYNSEAPRKPRFRFEFNDNVNAVNAASHASFISEDPPLTIPAQTSHATSKDFAKSYEPQPTWAEELAKVKPTLAEGATRLSALIVEPTEPLPVAKKWKLVLKPGLPNAAGHAVLEEGEEVSLGNVSPFLVSRVDGRTPFDRDYYLEIRFSKNLLPQREDAEWKPEDLKAHAAKVAEYIHVEPEVAGLKPEFSGDTLRLTGPFKLHTPYQVVIASGLAAGDGLIPEQAATFETQFYPNAPYVAAPAYVRTQLASGSGDFEVSVANVSQVRVRAHRLSGPELLQAVRKYEVYRSAQGKTEEKKRELKLAPLSSYPGSQVYDRTFPVNQPLDQSEMLKLNWREILGKEQAAPLMVELEGKASDGLKEKGVVTQSIVQFTDLGLMQKSNGRETVVFVTSLKTGAPVAGVRLTAVDAEQRLLGHADSDASGVAILKGHDPSWILAEKGEDCTVLDCNRSHIGGVIPYDIPRAWEDVWKPVFRTFVFSDRPLYRPGEMAHVKALTRLRSGDELSLAPANTRARLRLRDPRYRVVLDKEITFTASGSWAEDLRLPEGPLGWYEMMIDFNKPGEEEDGSSGFYSFRIEDYRPNTFEVKLDTTTLSLQPDRIRLPMTARYFMGKALSQAKVSWSAFSMREFTPPESWNRYHFGDAPYWARYGKDRDADGSYSHEADGSSEWWVNGDVVLQEDGTAVLEMPMPPPDRASLPQQVRVTAEVTDINQQTISGTAEFEVPGADYLLGLKGPEFFGSAGNAVQVDVVAIDSKGRPGPGSITAQIKVERQEYHTLKIATAGGGTTTRDQVILREELSTSVALKQETEELPPSAMVSFTPSRAGAYFITAEATDSQGRKVLSRLPVYVIGGGEFPWAMEDGARINLQPAAKKLAPGDEAVIVVKSPIAGTALVSVERNKVHRHFITQVSLDQPVIRVPIHEEEAPNVFVSVVVVRGSQDSPKKHPMPEYRMGYCQLEVDSKARLLNVALAPEKEEVKPGETLTIHATVTDAEGKPTVGSEVTLYAVDEGVLSLVKHQTPEPHGWFHEPMPLAIDNHTSFGDLLPEEFAARERGNKGFVIGGGGEMDDSPMQVRKNFVVTPLWIATAVTDPQGQVTASVTAPDNLTRYRIMAVASSGADRFGSGESAFKINKPLMVEPVVPRFARLGDETLIKAVIHNTTPNAGEVRVRLELDATSEFVHEERQFVPASLKPEAQADPRVWEQTVSIQAGETTSVAFPVRFAALGQASWKWSAHTTSWTAGAPALQDVTVSHFEVTHPMPELKEVHYARQDGAKPSSNLVEKINPALLEGTGKMSVTISASRLCETRDALEYVLQYPYGCAEQTTSATLPWLALGGYQSLFPDLLQPDKTREAIQRGVNRLLQMTTDEGGLAYWPGGQEPSFWASAYGGLMLLRAKEAGAAVPQEVLDGLTSYLSKQLRELQANQDLYHVTDCALALYTLAKAKKAEPAYQTMLHARREALPEMARLYTALAMCLTDAPAQQVKEMAGWLPGGKKASARPPAWTHWVGNQVNPALRLIVYTHLGLTKDAEELALGLLKSRNGRGEWGNTYVNAWALTSLAAHDRSVKKTVSPLTATLRWGTEEHIMNTPTAIGVSTATFDLNERLAGAPLQVILPPESHAFTRVEARAWPPEREFAGENKGYAIQRTYHKLLDDGMLQGTENLRVGDMVVVTLEMETQGGDRYLAINDPLPSVLEAINPDFESQNGRSTDRLPEGIENWFCDHRELRADRALFFTDFVPDRGRFQLRYLARVIGEGDVIAPPARIEAMYEPQRYGLSARQRLRTLPSGIGQVAGQ